MVEGLKNHYRHQQRLIASRAMPQLLHWYFVIVSDRRISPAATSSGCYSAIQLVGIKTGIAHFAAAKTV